MNLRKDVEYVIHCDEEGNIIGPLSKIHAHLPGARTSLTHYSTWSMIFNQKLQKYGIQKKNKKKEDKLGAGKWDMGVAGHNCYILNKNKYEPLNFNKNLIKEAKEEIGLNLKMFDSIAEFKKHIKKIKDKSIGIIIEKFLYKTSENNEYVGLGFILTNSQKIKFIDGEVVDFKWLTPTELREFLKKEKDYCSPLPLVFEKAEAFRLKYLK